MSRRAPEDLPGREYTNETIVGFRWWRGFCAGVLLLAGTVVASAQSIPANQTSPAARINAGTVGIISGGADGTYIRIAADLANVLDGDDLRVLPINRSTRAHRSPAIKPPSRRPPPNPVSIKPALVL